MSLLELMIFMIFMPLMLPFSIKRSVNEINIKHTISFIIINNYLNIPKLTAKINITKYVY